MIEGKIGRDFDTHRRFSVYVDKTLTREVLTVRGEVLYVNNNWDIGVAEARGEVKRQGLGIVSKIDEFKSLKISDSIQIESNDKKIKIRYYPKKTRFSLF
jgi:hypothetical protein